MKLLAITSLQEPNKAQFSVVFCNEIKKMMKAMGWKKKQKLAIYRHGTGFFFGAVSEQRAEQISGVKGDAQSE